MNNIENALEQDLKWRESELVFLKKLVINTKTGEINQKSLLRALWVLLYAHFEGFTKFCWDTLFDQIQAEKVPRKELSERYMIIALEKDFKSLRRNLESFSVLNFFKSQMPDILEREASFPEDSRLKTESNLWPNVFERENGKLGISCDELEKHRARIKTLVARRNDIAHGKSMVISNLKEYNEYENAALCLMHELAIKVIEITFSKSYKN
jgi:MAE_28990/MAE_18760-like HEPN